MARQIIDLQEMNDEHLSSDDLFVVRDRDQKKDKKITLLSLVDFFYPVGQIWTNDLVDPNVRFPGTEWEVVVGATIVSVDPTDGSIDTVGDIVGANAKTIGIANLPDHQHVLKTNYDDANYNTGTIPNGNPPAIPVDTGGTTSNVRYTATQAGIYSGQSGLVNSTVPTAVTKQDFNVMQKTRLSKIWVRIA